MPRKLRHIPEGGSLVEVTCRTIQSRLLLTPRPFVREIVIGILARAKQLYPVQFICFTFVSNHMHALAWCEDAHRLSEFMGYVNSNLAREVGRLADWKEKFWGRRYQSIVVSGEEAAQVERLRYHLAHGVKEGLVDQVKRWPGVHFAKSILGGKPLKGLWFNRTAEFAAKQRGEDFGRLKYAEEEELVLS